MPKIALLSGLAVSALLPLAAIAADHTIVQSDGLKWGPGPAALPKGAQIAPLYGDPSKEGAYAYRLKLPAGYKVAPHMHPNDENVTVMSGTFHIGMGDTLDEKKTEPIKAGGVLLMPKGMHHFAYFPVETVIQSNGVGPAGITYINDKDDPRKTQ